MEPEGASRLLVIGYFSLRLGVGCTDEFTSLKSSELDL